MVPAEDSQATRCPVCGTELPPETGRRCPRCGARTLWRPRASPVDIGMALFNLRLCGIMAGIQTAMLGLLLAGYQLPIPWGVAALAAALPVVGYLAAGELAQRAPSTWRMPLLAGALALNAGLMTALIAAIVGLSEPVTLAGLVAGVTILTAPLIRRSVAGIGQR